LVTTSIIVVSSEIVNFGCSKYKSNNMRGLRAVTRLCRVSAVNVNNFSTQAVSLSLLQEQTSTLSVTKTASRTIQTLEMPSRSLSDLIAKVISDEDDDT